MVKQEPSVPSAARLLVSLRDLGYDFGTAVADLIDNSVSAGAERVEVTMRFDGADSWVRIADDGTGMGGAAISEALRLGSGGGGGYDNDNLGKFGLGLKTASLSQARSITVASRTSTKIRAIECRRMDLDDILASDRWEIDNLTGTERPAEATGPLADHPGTVVLWQNLDRMLTRKDPFGGWAKKQMLRLAEDLEQHLGMVFGRFLSGEARRDRPLTITVNDATVEPWDPFCGDQKTQQMQRLELPVGSSFVRYRPYVLPPQRDFSDDESFRRASGPLQWNRQQGFYIYRGDRMIQSGGWSWMRGVDEHVKLARAALEFWPDLDEEFGINVQKMRVKLPEELRDQLKPLVGMLTKQADNRYRIAGRNTTPPAGPKKPKRVPPTIHVDPTDEGEDEDEGDVARDVGPPPGIGHHGPPAGKPSTQSPPAGPPSRPDPPARPESAGLTGRALEEAATRVGLSGELDRIRSELSLHEPGVARALGW